MDRVRLGRVLGRGTRLAARTAYEVLDAATAAPPRKPGPVVVPPQPPVRVVAEPVVRRGAGPGTVPPRQVRAGLFTPFRRATRAVSLEVTGSFFALFALSFGTAVWHQRDLLHAGRTGEIRFAAFCAVVVFFAYFAVSSFVRARRVR